MIPQPGPQSAESCCNAIGREIQSDLRRATHQQVGAARGRCRRLPDWATEYARKWPRARLAFFPSACVAARQSDSPEPKPQDSAYPRFPQSPPLQTCDSLPDKTASLERGRWDVYERYDRAAKGLRWQSRNSILLLLLCLAIPAATCSEDFLEGRATCHACPQLHCQRFHCHVRSMCHRRR